MTRSRVWWLSIAALAFSAVPALAYSWPTLFGLPSIFGQESSQPVATASSRPAPRCRSVQILPQASPTFVTSAPVTEDRSEDSAEACDEPCCPLVGDCLAAWHKLWKQGEYTRALGMARRAVQVAPHNVAARHALVVSQLATASMPGAAIQPLKPEWCELIANGCSLPGGMVLPTLQMPLLPFNCEIVGSPVQVCPDQERVLIQVQSAATGSALFGVGVNCDAGVCGSVEAKGCCEKCAKDCKCCCTKAQKKTAAAQAGCCTETARLATPQTVIVIVREPLGHVAPFAGPIMQVAPAALAAPVMPPAYSVGPADYAPPLPPPMAAPPIAVEQAIYEDPDRADACAGDPASVRILQRGGMCFVSSQHYEVRCDRVSGGGTERLVLEGNVTLVSRRHGQTLQIEAERVVLNLKTQQFQVENARGMDQTRVNVAPLTGPVGVVRSGEYEVPPAPLSSSEECTSPPRPANTYRKPTGYYVPMVTR
jgi:hypothetical protein